MQTVRMLKNRVIFWWYYPATLLFSFLEYKWSDYHSGIISNLIGGIEVSDGEILPIPMGRWLFIFGWIILIAGIKINRIKRLEVIEIYRHMSFRKWWVNRFVQIQILMLTIYIEMIAIWYGLENITGRKTDNILPIVVTFGLHMSVYIAIEICANILFVKGLGAGILIIMEGMSYVIAEQTRLDSLAIGMFVRSSRCIENGFSLPVIYGLEIILTALCCFFILLIEKGGGLENIIYRKME